MDRTKLIGIVAVAGVLLTGCSKKPDPVVVGSKTTTEQAILGEIVAQWLEKKLGNPVERKLNMGGTLDCHQALVAGQIDVYPEYTGPALTVVLKAPAMPDADIAEERVKREYAAQQLVWLPALGINKSFTVALRPAEAGQMHKLSDLEKNRDGWKLGATREFLERSDGFATLTRGYDVVMATPPTPLETADLYAAIDKKQVNAIVAGSTDSYLTAQSLTLMADDRHIFAPDRAALVTRMASLQRVPGLDQALMQLSGRISNETMQKLNADVDVRKEKVAEVAKKFVATL